MAPERAKQMAELAAYIQQEGRIRICEYHGYGCEGYPVDDERHATHPPNWTLRPAHLSASLAATLISLSNRLDRYNVTQCNYGLTDKQERAKERIREKVTKLVESAGLTVNHFSNDPRGNPVGINLPSGKYNTMGGQEHGYCF